MSRAHTICSSHVYDVILVPQASSYYDNYTVPNWDHKPTFTNTYSWKNEIRHDICGLDRLNFSVRGKVMTDVTTSQTWFDSVILKSCHEFLCHKFKTLCFNNNMHCNIQFFDKWLHVIWKWASSLLGFGINCVFSYHEQVNSFWPPSQVTQYLTETSNWANKEIQRTSHEVHFSVDESWRCKLLSDSGMRTFS
jgi:hypothetical protein